MPRSGLFLMWRWGGGGVVCYRFIFVLVSIYVRKHDIGRRINQVRTCFQGEPIRELGGLGESEICLRMYSTRASLAETAEAGRGDGQICRNRREQTR